MDEPLSNLDAKLRVQMRAEIARIQSDFGVTTIYVTHDQVEAMTMGDRVAVMRKGELQQVAPPTDLFNHPDNLFVAGFIGSPSMNFSTSKLEEDGGNLTLHLGDQKVQLDNETLKHRSALQSHVGRDVIVGIRPQDLEDASLAGEDRKLPRIKAPVDLVEPLGTQTLIHFRLDARMLVTEEIRELTADITGEGDDVAERDELEKVEFVAELDPRTKVRRGETAELVIDTSRIHFFDPETGAGIYGDG
jgi:multiple sugar transport system ATP-binding protein